MKNSIRNIALTIRRERFNQPLVGSKIGNALFDINDPLAMNEIKTTLEDAIRSDEPRAQNVIVEVSGANGLSPNEVKAQITFSMLNLPEQISFNVILKRVR